MYVRMYIQPAMGEGGWPHRNAQPPQPQQPSEKPPGATKPEKDHKGGFGGISLDGHYAECYPGAAEEYDATYDSDDEADYTKMDMVSVVTRVHASNRSASS